MKTALYDSHLSLGAKMIDFHGWQMPLQYSGIIDEHICTRTNVGLFDVSHMGRFEVTGDSSTECLQLLLTNDISRIPENKAIYSLMCNGEGGIIDDLILYKRTATFYTLVVNAGNREKDFEWISSHLTKKAAIRDVTHSTSLLALQGPKAKDILSKMFGSQLISKLGSFDFMDEETLGIKCVISRTGYTGEDGFEIMLNKSATQLWRMLFDVGREYQIKPCGLGSRDTLRLEAGLLLHGTDMDESTTPLEVPLKWTIKFDKGDFIGKRALLSKSRTRKLVGFEIQESKRIARHNNDVLVKSGSSSTGHGKLGVVTSGIYSPTLQKSIGFCFVPPSFDSDKEIKIDIGGRLYKARTRDKIRFIQRAK